MRHKEIETLKQKHLFENKLYFNKQPQNFQRYSDVLLESFQLELDLTSEYFISAPLSYWHDGVYDAGIDGEDYIAFLQIFKGKKWNEINLEILYEKYVEGMPLNENGFNYYLPALIKYFYDLRNSHLLFFDKTINNLAIGCVSTRYRVGDDGISYLVSADYSGFERFTPAQAKLIAAFLVHASTLYNSEEAQRALDNYWGKFLLS